MFSLLRTSFLTLALLFSSSVATSAPPSPDVEDSLTEYIVQTWKRPEQQVRQIVAKVLEETKSDEEAATVLGIIAKESAFNPSARSRGNHGLMQINVRTWGSAGMLSIRHNLEKGVAVFEGYKSRSLSLSLVRYNRGPGAAARVCSPSNPSRCDRDPYVVKVRQFRQQFLRLL